VARPENILVSTAEITRLLKEAAESLQSRDPWLPVRLVRAAVPPPKPKRTRAEVRAAREERLKYCEWLVRGTPYASASGAGWRRRAVHPANIDPLDPTEELG